MGVGVLTGITGASIPNPSAGSGEFHCTGSDSFRLAGRFRDDSLSTAGFYVCTVVFIGC